MVVLGCGNSFFSVCREVGKEEGKGVGKSADQPVGRAALKGRSGFVPANSWKGGLGDSTGQVASFTLKYWLLLHAITFYQLGESRAGTT